MLFAYRIFLIWLLGDSYELIDKLMNLGVRITAHPKDANADVTFIADTIAGKVHGCGKIVNVGHGTISKGYYFTESFWTEREDWVDLLCVPGEFAKNQFRNVLKTRVVSTGMPKMDPVFRGEFSRDQLCKELNLNPSKKIVLYAPTFNFDLSSLYDFADSFHLLENQNYYILIKLHGSTPPNFIQKYKEIANSTENIRYIEDTNLARYIGGADIMISDVSSAFMEFMALDKPVILYNNPNVKNYHGYNASNIEYTWRNLGTQVSSFNQLADELNHIIKYGDNKSEIRKEYAKQLFSDFNGNASKNVWKETLKLLKENSINKEQVIISIILTLNSENIIFIRNIISQIQFYSIMPIEFVIVKSKNELCNDFLETIKDFGEYYSLKVIDQIDKVDPVIQGLKNATGDYIIVLQDGVNIFKNFDYVIHKSFKANPDTAAITGLTISDNLEINFKNYINTNDNLEFERLAYEFINKFEGKELHKLSKSNQILPVLVLQKKFFDFDQFKSFHDIFIHLLENGKLYISHSFFYTTIDKGLEKEIKELWNRRFLIQPEMRTKIIAELIKRVSFPELFELLIDDLIRLNLRLPELVKIAIQSLGQRFYDIKYKQKLEKLITDQ